MERNDDVMKKIQEKYAAIGKIYFENNIDNDDLEPAYIEIFKDVKMLYKERDLIETKMLAKQGKRRCPNAVCQEIIPLESVFCNMCGIKLTPISEDIKGVQEEKAKSDINMCPGCGAELDDDAVFCQVCGLKCR